MCPVSTVPRHWMLQTKLQVASAGWFGIALRDSLSTHSRRPLLEIWVSLGIHILLNLERDSNISLRQKLWPGITHSVLQLSALAIIVFHYIPFIFCPHHFEQLEFPIPKVHQKLGCRRFQKSFYILFTFVWDWNVQSSSRFSGGLATAAGEICAAGFGTEGSAEELQTAHFHPTN